MFSGPRKQGGNLRVTVESAVLLVILLLFVVLTGLLLRGQPHKLSGWLTLTGTQARTDPDNVASLKLFPIANEVAAIMRSGGLRDELKRFSPGYSEKHPTRALVFIAPHHELDSLISNLFAARTIGRWLEKMIVLSDKFSANHRAMFDCLDTDAIILDSPVFSTTASSTKVFAQNHIIFKFVTNVQLLKYDIIQYIDVKNARISGPLIGVEESDFGNSDLLVQMQNYNGDHSREDLRSRFKMLLDQYPAFVQRINREKQNPQAWQIKGLAIMTRRIDAELLSTKIISAWNALNAASLLDDVHGHAILMMASEDRWMTYDFGSIENMDDVEFEPLLPSVTDKKTKQVEKFSSLADLRETFTRLVANSYLRCPAFVAQLAAPFDFDIVKSDIAFSRVVGLSSEFIRSLTPHVDIPFAHYYRSLLPLQRLDQEHATRRVLVHWASKGFIKEATAVLFEARTIGQWQDDVILLSDEVNNDEKVALECLGVRLITYSKDWFGEIFPYAPMNVWYFKLLPYVVPELRAYDIVQYLDLDVIITGPLKRRWPADFEEDVVLLLEDNDWDTSIMIREYLDETLKPEHRKGFLERFPGADEAYNGANKSPSSCACSEAIYMAKLDPPEILLKKMISIAKDYAYAFKLGDQPLVMLTFWGRWRRRFGDMDWHTPYERVFDPNLLYRRTGAPVRIIHTTGENKPTKPESRYHIFDVFTKALAAELLECPAILKVG